MQRENLALFFALQSTRTLEAWDAEAEIGDMMMRLEIDLSLTNASPERLAGFAEEIYGRSASDSELEGLKLVAENIEQVRFRPPASVMIAAMFRTALEMAPIFALRPWTLLHSEKKPFVTCDRPIVLWRPRRRQDDHLGVGVATAEVIYVPLDPKHMLLMEHGTDSGWAEAEATPAMVRHINHIVSDWSYRYVFHHPKHQPLKGESLSPEGPVVHINGIAVRPGVNVWNILRKRFHEGTTLPVIHFGYNVDRRRRR